jgi:hypothetical protein
MKSWVGMTRLLDQVFCSVKGSFGEDEDGQVRFCKGLHVLLAETVPGGNGVWSCCDVSVEDDELAAALATGSTTIVETDEDNSKSKIAREDGFLNRVLLFR